MTKTVIRFRSMSESAEKQEIEDAKKNVYPVIGFLVAMEIFGVCLQEVHAHAQELRPLHRHFELPILITAADTVSLLILLKVQSRDGLMKHAEGLIVTFISHICMEYLFNFWYIYSRNDSFAVGYFEPVILMLLLKVCTRTGVTFSTVAILVIMSLCAGFTSGEIGILVNANRNGIVIFLVIMFISLRNIGLKLLHEEGVHLNIRQSVAIPYITIMMFIGVVLSAFHLTFWALPVMFALISMFASVSTLYFNSALLESMNVLTIAVLGLVSQICVNAVCIPVEHAHNVVITLFATLVLLAIIAVYFRSFTSNESLETLKASVPHHEIYTRIEFLIFTGLVLGIIFYVFKPKISERDLNNLHYVGLDNIMKLLINHD